MNENPIGIFSHSFSVGLFDDSPISQHFWIRHRNYMWRACRAGGIGGNGAFGRSVNPISTWVGRFSLPNNLSLPSPPRIFKPSVASECKLSRFILLCHPPKLLLLWVSSFLGNLFFSQFFFPKDLSSHTSFSILMLKIIRNYKVLVASSMDARKLLSSSISSQVEVAAFGNWSFETSFSHLMEG